MPSQLSQPPPASPSSSSISLPEALSSPASQLPPPTAARFTTSHLRSWFRLPRLVSTFSYHRLLIILLIFLLAFFSLYLHSPSSRSSATKDTNSEQVNTEVLPLPAVKILPTSEVYKERRRHAQAWVLECRPVATSWSVIVGDQCMKLSRIFVGQRRFPLLLFFHHHLELNSQSIKPTVEQLSYIFHDSSISRDPYLLTMGDGELGPEWKNVPRWRTARRGQGGQANPRRDILRCSWLLYRVEEKFEGKRNFKRMKRRKEEGFDLIWFRFVLFCFLQVEFFCVAE